MDDPIAFALPFLIAGGIIGLKYLLDYDDIQDDRARTQEGG